ncbi:hypothetical protein LJ707_18355 [Mucilaginibacter sp. UR6-1]|uniref:DUF4175 family protein n=1 Tax=Mucilaginibacter sp. UR6-1 TaxID=1435643 RepID=UPI001E458B85|nr:DUF4175 family protein [Mucilaginibacter sp. UR6-1]MCC8410909.1 hypothetical protein [Mucilaginibacter sp. UR6-1]
MNNADNFDLLIVKVNTFIRKYYFNNLLRGIILLGAGLFSLYLIIALAEYFGNFNIVLRSVLFYLFILINVALLVWLVIPSFLAWLRIGKTITYDEAAVIIGRHFGNVNDKLLNTLQLKKQALADPNQRQLLEAGIDQKINELNPVSFPSAINLKENTRYLKWILIPLGAICIIALAAPSILTDSTERLLKHDKYFAPVAPFRFVVQNPSLTAVQGDDLTLELKLEGNNLPTDVYIENGGNTFRLEKKSVSSFTYTFKNLQQNVPFRLTANGYNSTPYVVNVNYKPTLVSFDATLQYPAYLHKQTETIANAGDLTIPAGTLVKWHIKTQHASTLAFNIGQKQHVLSAVAEDMFTYQEKITSNTSYKISASNQAVKRNTDSSAYNINMVADQAPAISAEQKQDSVSSKALYFNGSIQDDHGFSALTFNYRIGDKLYRLPVKAELSQTQAGFFFFWNLKELKLPEGAQVSYYFEVADNDAVSGPKKARTPEQTLNIPDAKQLNEQLAAGTKAVADKTQSAIKLAAQIERESQKLNQQLLDKNNLSFEEKKQVEQLLQKKLELNKLVKDIQDENRKNQYNRQENQQQSSELQQKQQQIADLFNNVLDPKTQDLLKKLQDLLDKGEKDDTRDELKKMQQDNHSLKKELDRVLELYKKLAFDQKVEQNINQLNKLAEEQKKLAEQTTKQNQDKNELLQKQQKLKEEFNEAKKSLDELKKDNEALSEKMDLKDQQKQGEEVDQQMDDSKQNLQKNDKQKAAKAQQQAAQKMQQMAAKMQQQQQEGEESENNVNAEQLRELLKSLVNSSFSQEKLMVLLRGISPADPGYTGLAQQQKDIKDNLKTAEDSLYSLSKRVPQIQSAVNKEVTAINENIDKALSMMGERRSAEAGRSQQYAMTAMNNLALLLSEALEQLQNMQNRQGGGKGKKQQSVSQLAKMQQQLNKNMQQARQQMQQQGNQGKSGQGQNSMSEQLARMARQQQQIRQALDQINREQNKDGRNGSGNLDKISKEMEQTENDIVNRRITEETVKRQQQIQTRLLDAEKAEQQREQDNKRQSAAGKDMPPGYIKALQNYQQIKTKQTEQLRTVSPAFNLYYKNKIQAYFEQLNGK